MRAGILKVLIMLSAAGLVFSTLVFFLVISNAERGVADKNARAALKGVVDRMTDFVSEKGIDNSRMMEIIRGVVVGYEGYVFTVSKEGRISSHPDPSKIGKTPPEHIKDGGFMDIDGKNVLTCVTAFGGQTLVAVMVYDEVYAGRTMFVMLYAAFTLGLFMLFCFVVSRYINRRIIVGVKRVLSVVDAISRGNLQARAEVRTSAEFERLSDGINAMAHNLAERLETLERLGYIDQLTGITNRRGFDERFETEFRRAERDQSYLSVIMADADKFKNYNDTYGHADGDELLKLLARILADSLKRPGDVVARYGGEEFVVLLPGTDPDGAKYVAESMRRNVEKGLHLGQNGERSCTISLGVTTTKFDIGNLITPQALFEQADMALYTAKETGRNRVYVYREGE